MFWRQPGPNGILGWLQDIVSCAISVLCVSDNQMEIVDTYPDNVGELFRIVKKTPYEMQHVHAAVICIFLLRNLGNVRG